jgi:hypothetical protein
MHRGLLKMAEKIKFTQDRIRNLPIPEKGRVDYYDIKVPKLTCRVSSTGNKSFVVLIDFQKINFLKSKNSFEDILISAEKKPSKEYMNDNTKLFKINSGKTARKPINSLEVKQYSFIPNSASCTLVC